MFGLVHSTGMAAAIDLAPRLAAARLHNAVGPEHLLLAALSPGSRGLRILGRVTDANIAAHWNEVWPQGMRPPHAAPPHNARAKACLASAAAAARLREASVVTGVDLIEVVLQLEDPAFDDLRSRLGVTSGSFGEAREQADRLEQNCLDACVKATAIRPAPGAIGGILAWHPVLPIEVPVERGPIAGCLIEAGRRAAGAAIDTLALLDAVQVVDPVLAYPFEVVAERARRLPPCEGGAIPFDVEGARLELTSACAFAVGAAMMLADCYRLQFTRHELVAAGLVLGRGSRVRQAFEDTLLGGLTTTRSHVEHIAALSLADLPAVVRSISLALSSIMPPPDGGPFISLGDERWDLRDSDPLAVLDHVWRCGLGGGTGKVTSDRLGVVIERAQSAIGDRDDDHLAFRQIALQGLWAAELVRGDRAAGTSTAHRLVGLAERDAWATRIDCLAAWIPGRARRQVAPPDPELVAGLLRSSSPPEVIELVRRTGTAPTKATIRAVEARRRAGSNTSRFASTGLVEDVLRLIAKDGIERAGWAVRSPRAEARTASLLGYDLGFETFHGIIGDRIAESGYEQVDALLSDLDAASRVQPGALDDKIAHLRIAASHAMGSDHESRYLSRLASSHCVLAEKAAHEDARTEASELAHHALTLLAVAALTSPGEASVLGLLLGWWWSSARDLASGAQVEADTGRIAWLLAVGSVVDREELGSFLRSAAVRFTGSTDTWVRRLARCVQVNVEGGAGADVASPLSLSVSREQLDQLVDATNAAAVGAIDDRSAAGVDALVAATVATLAAARWRDETAVGLWHRCLLASARCLEPGERLDAAAQQIHVAMRAIVESRATVPVANWRDVVRTWIRVAGCTQIKAMDVRQLNFDLLARAYHRADSIRGRGDVGLQLALAADALAGEFVEQGDAERAAIMLEMTADLGLLDRRTDWKPARRAWRHDMPVVNVSVGDSLDPYLLCFTTPRHDSGKAEWATTRAGMVHQSPWPLDRSVLALVPVPGGTGYLVALEEGTWTGWRAPGLDDELAQLLLAVQAGEVETGYALLHAALAEAVPKEAAAWIGRQKEVAIIGRGWSVAAPFSASFAQSAGPTPSFLWATSVADLARFASRAPFRVLDAVVVTDPQPTSVAPAWSSGVEARRLVDAAEQVHILTGANASPAAVEAALGRTTDVFHFGGAALEQGIVLAYDTAYSPSYVRYLAVAPSRATVLGTGGTAFPSIVDAAHESMVSAFVELGCPAVVGCLWQMDDIASILLVDALYEDLLGTGWVSVAESLQRAVDWLRAADRVACSDRLASLFAEAAPGVDTPSPPDTAFPYADPRHWAGFVCYGA